MRLSLSLVVAVLVTSCVVPPSCLTPQRGAATVRKGHLVTVTLFSQPAAEAAPTSQAAGIGIWEQFERAGFVIIDGKGGMSVSDFNFWPDR